MEELPAVRFRSTAFPKYPDENEEIVNEECWGKRLAEFMRDQLPKFGVATEEIRCEDWGWMVEIKNDAFPLFLGCGPMRGVETEEEKKGEPIEFMVMICVDVGLFYRIFTLPFKAWFKKPDIRPDVERVEAGLRQLIAARSEFQDVIWETIPAK